mgnify:CR=1 FL=1
MINLYIDNKQVIIKNGTSIKLTRENPFFTGSGDYTLDVTLPLAGCKQNLEVFGMLHFAPVSHKPLATKKLSFCLMQILKWMIFAICLGDSFSKTVCSSVQVP